MSQKQHIKDKDISREIEILEKTLDKYEVVAGLLKQFANGHDVRIGIGLYRRNLNPDSFIQKIVLMLPE